MAAWPVVCQVLHQRPVTLHPDRGNIFIVVELLVYGGRAAGQKRVKLNSRAFDR